jgi:hypothetical protein
MKCTNLKGYINDVEIISCPECDLKVIPSGLSRFEWFVSFQNPEKFDFNPIIDLRKEIKFNFIKWDGGELSGIVYPHDTGRTIIIFKGNGELNGLLS